MIVLVTGVPGSGKSLALVKRYIIPSLRKGRQIYTNIDGLNDAPPNDIILNLSFVSSVPPEDVEKLLHPIPSVVCNKVLDAMPGGAIAVIDEAQIYWNARDYSTDKNKGILPYFQKHRHYGHDVVLATQHFEQLDSGIRRLAEVKYKSHNVFLRSPMMWVCFLFFCYFAWFVFSGRLSAFARWDMAAMRGGSKPAEVPFRERAYGYLKSVYGDAVVFDYWCHRKLYVQLSYGNGGFITDTLDPKKVPSYMCPSFGYLSSKEAVSL